MWKTHFFCGKCTKIVENYVENYVEKLWKTFLNGGKRGDMAQSQPTEQKSYTIIRGMMSVETGNR